MRFLLAGIGLSAFCCMSSAFEVGVNLHDSVSASENTAIAAIMKQRNFKSARLGLVWNRDERLKHDVATKILANGNGSNTQAVLNPQYTFERSCSQDFATVQRVAYDQTRGMVNQFKDVIHDFELMNEITDRPELKAEVPRNTGSHPAMYENKPCYATIVAVLKGMSRAIADVRAQSGLPLRIILGTSSRDWGFVSFIASKGVQWDVTGFHIYPHLNHPSLLSDPWYGAGGPLAQLAKIGKPIHINEFNCNEIYDSNYRNEPGNVLFEQCMKSLARHLNDLRKQTIANIERIHIYELRDSPFLSGAETRFGLMYSLDKAKPHLYLATAFAGGELSVMERAQIISRGLGI